MPNPEIIAMKKFGITNRKEHQKKERKYEVCFRKELPVQRHHYERTLGLYIWSIDYEQEGGKEQVGRR